MSRWWLKDPEQLELVANWKAWDEASGKALEDGPTWEVYGNRVSAAWAAYMAGWKRIREKYAKAEV